jgi:hypothetical protein
MHHASVPSMTTGLALLASAGACAAVHVDTAAGLVALSNGRCRLELSSATGEIVSLRPGPSTLRGRWFEVVEEAREGLSPWETWAHGEEQVFSGGPATVSAAVVGRAAEATLVWVRPTGLQVRGQVRLEAGDAGPHFRLEVRNQTGAVLVDALRLPVLRGIELDGPEDDWLTWPHTLGARFRVQGFDPGERIEAAYPDFLYMQWLDLHDDRQGVYLGCLDDYGWCKNLFIGREADGRSVMGIAFTGCWIAKPGDSWTTPWVQIAAHEGDWRAGADLYRPFAEAAFGPLDPPQRVREMPTAQCWLAHHASDGDVGRLFEVQQQAPIHASYLMKSLNTSIPEGWDGFRGSALELQEAFGRIRELGGSPALFTFDRAPVMGRPNYAEHVGRWTSVRRDGSFAEGFRDMMPSPFDPDLVRARVGEATRWVQAFGIDEIHFDTAATTGPALAGPSYRVDLPQRPNETPHRFKALYRAIRDACREHNPEFILRAEHCADFFYPEFLTSTAHFFETGNVVAAHNPPTDAQLLPILFRYTLPRHAALQMPSMSENDFWTYGYGMGHGFHGGGPSWCFNPGVRDAESPPGELLHRYRFYDAEWRRYYDFRVGFAEAVIEGERSDCLAQAEIEGEWRPCVFPGPLIAVTHTGGGQEVTLGQWFHKSHTQYFGERFVGPARLAPRPVRLRVPTRLRDPQVRLFGQDGELPARPRVADGVIEIEVRDPTCFALEASSGPSVTLHVPDLAHPGQSAEVEVIVRQAQPTSGAVEFTLPAGWPSVKPLRIPARPSFRAVVPVPVPAGVFGRNYPLKAVLRLGFITRTTAAHMRAIEPVTVLYAFETLGESGAPGPACVDPGRRARLTVTCVNNTPATGTLTIQVDGEQVLGEVSEQVPGVSSRQLGDPDSALCRWTDGRAGPPPNALIRSFEYDCTGVPNRPVTLAVGLDGSPVFRAEAWPRTRLMDLNGTWQVGYMPRSRATVGGAERQDNLDPELMTPDVWDGDWEARPTPLRFDEQARNEHQWGLYRRLVFVPAEWQGAEVFLRLSYMGAPWGVGGTLNLVYVNGWPAGRIGTGGECPVSPFLVFGGWNLLAVGSYSPNSLVDPYLFVRGAPAPDRLRPAPVGEPPIEAFLLLGQRCTGQGLTMPFIKGVPEGDHRRTDTAAGGENVFIYFAVADAFCYEPDGPVRVAVEYLDEGTAPFGLDYDSRDETAPIQGAFKSAPPGQRTDTGEWKTHVFVLPDARLANRQHLGSDFRLSAQGNDDLHVRKVVVLVD